MEGREQVALIAVCATAASMPGAALGDLVQDLVSLAGVMAAGGAVDLAAALRPHRHRLVCGAG
ncbi:hypothetical protein [Kitasatospora sp. NPDC056181]|uniref:hypothetical protein n=1 Tax=Kitasatospora sp. NPDC056181 TaxID=3345737 RepID=UPI0035DF1B38